ncbi:MAG: hypothetical protein M3350_05385 [Actinomycetota bacterium]|nr:hypothetical protein [Actinomycetota bacterium]
MRSVFQRWLSSAFVLALALLAGASLANSAATAAPKANGKIAFVSFQTGDPEVYTMHPDGSRKTQLTSNAGPFPDLPFLDFWPSWSPRGSKIVFTSFRNFNLDVYTMNQNGTGLTRVTRHPAGDLDPAFFPDGRKIVFVRELPGPDPDGPPAAQDIYTANTDGTGERNLTPGPERETEPAISPDGKTIAFEREVGSSGNHEGGNHEIFTINADGTRLKRLTNTATGREQHPNFSPDGKKIVFDDNFHAPPGVAGAIYTMNVDGSEVKKLTGNRTDRHGLGAYSPDGKKISFTASEDIHVMNTDGSRQRRLTRHPAPEIQASWAPAIPCATKRRGSGASETIRGTTLGDRLVGLSGNDRLLGRQADDCLFGGGGRDRLSGAQGEDRLRGESGNDTLAGSSGRDRLSGGSGNDKLRGDSGGDRLWGRGGRDRLSGGSANDRLDGGSGNDRLNGGSGRNRLSGGDGNDRIDSANGRRESVNCGLGRDIVRADRSDRLRGCERVRRR